MMKKTCLNEPRRPQWVPQAQRNLQLAFEGKGS
jgi:hypothetical protein